MNSDSLPTLSPDADLGRTFSRCWAIGLLGLIGVTYPLWIPSELTLTTFPSIGLVKLPTQAQVLSSLVGALFVLIGLVCNALRPGTDWRWGLVSLGFGLLVIVDQHRLQPWCYQAIVYGCLLASLPWREARRWVSVITASIYLYSAAGKLDYQFVHTVGREIVSQPLGLFLDNPAAHATQLAVMLPISELMIGAMLLVPFTRRVGGIAAMVMHATLFVLLGPWALNHSFGVLGWNLVLAFQAWLLFVKSPGQGSASSTNPAPDQTPAGFVWKSIPYGTRVFACLILVAPITERVGIWDHWTSWSLYSPHTSRAIIEVHQSALQKLPASVRDHLQDTEGDQWYRLKLEPWSFESRLVPIYPQARYQLAIADVLAATYELQQAIRVELRSTSDRWTGKRQSTYLIGTSEVGKARAEYWLPLRKR
ncbi:MauE/DoxX family redox-associated membrane protein [Roseiconus lacunae]|uniref:MauE/DoxX family redox-associated membrane protein n=1 Tax=Roseiconus lacunae TaxID=2605694 RepID=UPI0013599EAA|nr:MauE/DoxX family redox-associated membrane protein [Roseiconus lacunae]